MLAPTFFLAPQWPSQLLYSRITTAILVTQVCTEFDVTRFFIALKYCLPTVVWVLQNIGYQQ